MPANRRRLALNPTVHEVQGGRGGPEERKPKENRKSHHCPAGACGGVLVEAADATDVGGWLDGRVHDVDKHSAARRDSKGFVGWPAAIAHVISPIKSGCPKRLLAVGKAVGGPQSGGDKAVSGPLGGGAEAVGAESVWSTTPSPHANRTPVNIVQMGSHTGELPGPSVGHGAHGTRRHKGRTVSSSGGAEPFLMHCAIRVL
jgi:hypothetical protein